MKTVICSLRRIIKKNHTQIWRLYNRDCVDVACKAWNTSCGALSSKCFCPKLHGWALSVERLGCWAEGWVWSLWVAESSGLRVTQVPRAGLLPVEAPSLPQAAGKHLSFWTEEWSEQGWASGSPSGMVSKGRRGRVSPSLWGEALGRGTWCSAPRVLREPTPGPPAGAVRGDSPEEGMRSHRRPASCICVVVSWNQTADSWEQELF